MSSSLSNNWDRWFCLVCFTQPSPGIHHCWCLFGSGSALCRLRQLWCLRVPLRLCQDFHENHVLCWYIWCCKCLYEIVECKSVCLHAVTEELYLKHLKYYDFFPPLFTLSLAAHLFVGSFSRRVTTTCRLVCPWSCWPCPWWCPAPATWRFCSSVASFTSGLEARWTTVSTWLITWLWACSS